MLRVRPSIITTMRLSMSLMMLVVVYVTEDNRIKIVVVDDYRPKIDLKWTKMANVPKLT